MLPWFPRKPYLIPDQIGESLYPAFRPKRSKNPTRWGGTYLYMAYIREYPLGVKDSRILIEKEG